MWTEQELNDQELLDNKFKCLRAYQKRLEEVLPHRRKHPKPQEENDRKTAYSDFIRIKRMADEYEEEAHKHFNDVARQYDKFTTAASYGDLFASMANNAQGEYIRDVLPVPRVPDPTVEMNRRPSHVLTGMWHWLDMCGVNRERVEDQFYKLRRAVWAFRARGRYQ